MSRYFNELYFSNGENDRDNSMWFPLPGYYPDYSICENGFVMRNKTGKILKWHKGDKKGHLNVRLRVNKKTKEEYVHRLLAKTFIPNPKKLPIVRHLDDDVENNSLDNLAWGTVKDNIHDSIRNGTNYILTDEDREKSYLKTRIPVKCVNLKTGKEKIYKGKSEAARELGLQSSNIYKVLTGKRKHTGGYFFEKLEKEGIND